MIKIIKCLVKIKLKFSISWANFVKLFNHLKSLHKPPCCFTLSTFLSVREFFDPCDCGQISENIFFFLNLLVKKIFFDKDHWFQLLSTKNDWIISLFLISITLHSLSLGHSIFSFCWQKNNLCSYMMWFSCQGCLWKDVDCNDTLW